MYFSLNKACNVLPKQVNLRDNHVSVVDCYISPQLLLKYTPCTVKVYKNVGGSFTYVKTVFIVLPDLSNYHLLASLNNSLKDEAKFNITDSAGVHLVLEDDLRLIFSPTLTLVLGLKDCVVEGPITSKDPLATDFLANRITILGNFVENMYCHGVYLPCVYHGPAVYHNGVSEYHKTLDMTYGCLDIRILNFAHEEIVLPDGSYSISLHFKEIPKH